MNKNEIKQKVEDNKKIIFTGIMLSLLLIFSYVGFTQEIGSVTVVPAENQQIPGDEETVLQETTFDSTTFNMFYLEYINCENIQEFDIECEVHWMSLVPGISV